MYVPFLEQYIDDIIDINISAEKVAKMRGFKNAEELGDVWMFIDNNI